MTSVHWRRAADADLALDVLDVHATGPKEWCFVWPGRMVVESTTTEIVEPYAVVRATGSFRVLFELGPTSLQTLEREPLDAFRAAARGVPRSLRLRAPIARARDLIAQSDVSLTALSAAVGVERCRLCRVFHRAVGLPPVRFRLHLRIARARKLLAAGYDCLTVAHEVGFCDQSHLNRWFKELAGTTPGAYASACAIKVRTAA